MGAAPALVEKIRSTTGAVRDGDSLTAALGQVSLSCCRAQARSFSTKARKQIPRAGQRQQAFAERSGMETIDDFHADAFGFKFSWA